MTLVSIRAIAAAAIALSVAGTASAADRLSDVEYIKANRCRAIATSNSFGSMDPRDVDALLRSEARGRSGAVAEMARDAQSRARHQADDPRQKDRLARELDSDCLAYLRPATALGQP